MKKRIFALFLCFVTTNLVVAQGDENIPSLVGSWEGPLVIGRDSTNLAFTFSLREGQYAAALISGGMGIYGMPRIQFRSMDAILLFAFLDWMWSLPALFA